MDLWHNITTMATIQEATQKMALREKSDCIKQTKDSPKKTKTKIWVEKIRSIKSLVNIKIK